ncbi:MAG: winged helix-turn-helix transcriptional regulator [Methanogenium sp.]|nr:winged helix-turn-helix transcriptional regulator [Methanogenium sp.]
MINRENDPLYIILRSKREATRFQILVEIAEHQPSVRQQEIAEILGVTPQAVSEYIRELVDDGMVASHGRGRYNVTHTGIEWVMNNAEALESYAHHVTHEVIQPVVVWTALSASDIKKGDTVGVFMKGGMLFADFGKHAATGMATLDAEKGMDVGVSNLTGIIDHSEGIVHVCKVPRIERGGSRNVSRTLLLEVIDGVDVVGAVGLEADVSLKAVGREPDMFFGAREGIIEAVFHGLECAIIIVDEEFTDFLKRLETAGVRYVIHDLVSA